MSEELERIGVEAVFETLTFKKRFDEYVALLDQSNKKTAEAAAGMSQSMAKVSNEIDLAGKGWQGAVSDMLKAGASVQDVARFFGVSADEVRAFAAASGESATSSIQAAQGADQQAAATERVAASTKKAESYITRYLKRMALWLTIGAAVRGIVTGITRTISENIKRIYEGTDEYKNFQTQVDRLGLAFTAVIAPGKEFRGLLDLIAKAAEYAGDGIASMGADMWASISVMGEYISLVNEWGEAVENLDLTRAAELAQQINEFQTGGAVPEKLAQKRAEYMAGFQDVMGMAGQTEAEEKFAKAVKDLAEILRDTDEELERHKQAVSLIHGAYDEAAAQAVVDYWDRNKQITEDTLADIEKIEADAARDIEKIRRNNEKKITNLIQNAQKDRTNDEERHQLDMQFRRRRFELSQVQNERMYQARRRRLVGEGDVLAIEELDEQYELQRQAAEENFNLQMEQAEAMYQLQARIQEESMQRQIQMLREAMAEQIAEVEAAKAEQIAEVQAAAAEEEELNKQKRDKELYDAKVARDQALADEAAAHKKRMTALAEQFRQLEEAYDLGTGTITRIVQTAFGVGSPMDLAVKNSFERWMAYADQAAQHIAGVYNAATYGGGGYAGGPGRGPSPRNLGTGPYGYQAGTAGGRPQLFSKPTLIKVAENRPEMLSVQPTYGGGSVAMSLSWTGGPIPLRGEGSLSGADLSQVASGITIAIMSRMKKSYQNMYAPGG